MVVIVAVPVFVMVVTSVKVVVWFCTGMEGDAVVLVERLCVGMDVVFFDNCRGGAARAGTARAATRTGRSCMFME